MINCAVRNQLTIETNTKVMTQSCLWFNTVCISFDCNFFVHGFIFRVGLFF